MWGSTDCVTNLCNQSLCNQSSDTNAEMPGGLTAYPLEHLPTKERVGRSCAEWAASPGCAIVGKGALRAHLLPYES